jgi:hypothetical protein
VYDQVSLPRRPTGHKRQAHLRFGRAIGIIKNGGARLAEIALDCG